MHVWNWQVLQETSAKVVAICMFALAFKNASQKVPMGLVSQQV